MQQVNNATIMIGIVTAMASTFPFACPDNSPGVCGAPKPEAAALTVLVVTTALDVAIAVVPVGPVVAPIPAIFKAARSNS